MTLILAIIPVLLLIVLMAFFKMSGDKSSIISLIVTMLIALFGFAFSVELFRSFILSVQITNVNNKLSHIFVFPSLLQARKLPHW